MRAALHVSRRHRINHRLWKTHEKSRGEKQRRRGSGRGRTGHILPATSRKVPAEQDAVKGKETLPHAQKRRLGMKDVTPD